MPFIFLKRRSILSTSLIGCNSIQKNPVLTDLSWMDMYHVWTFIIYGHLSCMDIYHKWICIIKEHPSCMDTYSIIYEYFLLRRMCLKYCKKQSFRGELMIKILCQNTKQTIFMILRTHTRTKKSLKNDLSYVINII